MNRVVGGCYIVGKKLGKSDQEVYEGVHFKTGQMVVIKFADKVTVQQLQNEIKILHVLQNSMGQVPRFLSHGRHNGDHFMVTERLGENLSQLFRKCKRFDLKTNCAIAMQLLMLLKLFHEFGFVHRGMKPDNVLIGKGINQNKLYLIDFEVTKRFMNTRTKAHFQQEWEGFTGNGYWCSLDAHRGLSQSPRNDLESLGYMLVYFMKGKLPWSSDELKWNLNDKVKATLFKKWEPAEYWYAYKRSKKNSIQEKILCKNLPEEFQLYFDHVMSLKHEDKPNYSYLHNLFHDLLKRENLEDDGELCWNSLSSDV